MFHLFEDVMHTLKDADEKNLKLVLSLTHPYALGLDNVEDLKKYYWLWADVVDETFKKIEKLQYAYYQSGQEIDRIYMELAERDYERQLTTLMTFSQFYACHHYLGTAGFENVSLD